MKKFRELVENKLGISYADENNFTKMYDMEDVEFLSRLYFIIKTPETLRAVEKNLKDSTGTSDLDFISNIILKRFFVLVSDGVIKEDLISPTIALAASYLNIDNPGKAVLFLIDVLNTLYDGKSEVTLAAVIGLYPNGFYTTETFIKIVDNLIKPKEENFDFNYLY